MLTLRLPVPNAILAGKLMGHVNDIRFSDDLQVGTLRTSRRTHAHRTDVMADAT